MKEEPFLIANRIQTPDGTILWSRHRHDYIEYKDDNGETYVLDGGTDYQRGSVNKIPAKNLSVWSDAPFEEIRQVMLRGTFTGGKENSGERIWVPLYKLNDLHLIGILDYNEERGIKSKFDQFIEKEIEYRKEHNIKIEDGAYHWEDGIHIKDNFD